MRSMARMQLVELLGDIQRRLMKRLGPYAREQGLSTTEALVLWKLHARGTCRVTELATDMGLPPSTLTGILDRLTGGGWLEREPDPEDRRGVVMKSTEKLGEFIQHTLRASSRGLERTFRQLPPRTIERLTMDLRAVLECLERDEEKKRE